MRLLVLAIIVVMVLVILAVARAYFSRKSDQGWVPIQSDWDNETVITLVRPGYTPRQQARIPLDAPDYSIRVIEAWAAAETKARDWNTTRRAIAER